MERKEFYEILDIEKGEDFQYFENIAELFESDFDIEEELIFNLLSEVNLEILEDLIKEYFKNLEDWIPDGEDKLFTTLSNIERNFISKVNCISGFQDSGSEFFDVNPGDDTKQKLFELAEEIIKFRNWYSILENVVCINNDDGTQDKLAIRDALGLCKEEKLGGKSYRFDFSEGLEYDMADYIVSFSDLASMMW